ncbi:catalytic phage domain protein : Uncharacterized protein OS=Rhodopirellula maiorica SM1 GN=RMSM_00903 PE=4 SV=1: Phage_integrase [Gemmata massiliana]|uniref:Tyr recombinase domain-containing protein n=1 Tax=Gemmata massiliana TaxID=1210884 RepID=A0A6P2CSR0_9BACT|nr:tyrosine-type recombinase/integrase [Gemmata massiliana]VTR92138.1 catalytic phage domain protein : Uncharacterized protein OS=Rhodopirellula maiorica SM1 GN=RMSM_00903 PE=4 SV=1: Phage_integrase [Gemmata massiliana]
MRRNPAPSYCHHKPSNQAFVTVLQDGKLLPRYLGKWGTDQSLTAYREVLTELNLPQRLIEQSVHVARSAIAFPEHPTPPEDPSVITVRVLADRFLAWAPGYYRLPKGGVSREVVNFKHSFRDVLIYLGDRPTASLTKQDLEEVRERMIARGLSRKVINQQLSRVVHAFRWGTEEKRNLVPETVASVLRLLTPLEPYRSGAPEKRAVVGAPREHVERVIAVAPCHIADMLRLQLLNGFRPGEVRGLKKNMIVIREGLWVADFGIEHKMAYRKQLRIVPLGTEAVALLQPWIDRAPTPESYLFRPELVRRSRLKGNQFSNTNYGHSILTYCKQAGVPRFAPNQVRHTVGEEVRRSHGLEHVQAILGHKTRQSSERYAPVVQELAVIVANTRKVSPRRISSLPSSPEIVGEPNPVVIDQLYSHLGCQAAQQISPTSPSEASADFSPTSALPSKRANVLRVSMAPYQPATTLEMI